MNRVVLIGLIVIIFFSFCFSQDYNQIGVEFTKALYDNETHVARIKALKALVQKYTDTSNMFVKLAHYQLAINYFENKNYSNAIKAGNKRFTMGAFTEGLEARLHLVMANCYAIKGNLYNKDKALKHVNNAIKIAKTGTDRKLIQAANNLKKTLAVPVKPSMKPEQKIIMHYQNEEYSKVISLYSGLSSNIKSKPEIHQIYAYSLYKANRLETALKEFKAIYSREKKGGTASRIADVYIKKAQKNKNHLNSAVNYFLEAGLLFEKEMNSKNRKAAFQNAKYWLFEKHGYNKEYRGVKDLIRREQSSAQKNKKAIRIKEKELRKYNRRLERDYYNQDLDPPPYELKKLKKLEQEIKMLKSGGTSKSNAQIEALEKKKKDIEKEYESLKSEVKKLMKL